MTHKQTTNPDAVFEALETVAELVSFHATAIEKLAHVTTQLNQLVNQRQREMLRRLNPGPTRSPEEEEE